MENTNEKTKFLYATAYSGQVLKIPLKDYVNQDYIIQRLLDVGVGIDQMKYVSFSTKEPNILPALRSSYPTRAQVEAALDSPFPPYPRPANPDVWPAQWSEIMVRKYTPLIDLKNAKRPFCMTRSDDVKVDIWSFDTGKYKDPAQWTEIKDGKIGLLYAVAWKQKNVQKITESMRYEQRLAITHGMSTNTHYSISATLGASGFGLSASLSATFGQSFLIEESSTLTDSLVVEGVTGKVLVVAIWQLVDLFYLVKKDTNGNYVFIDGYKIVLDEKGENTYHADPMFFGNTEQTDDGKAIKTNMVHLTDNVPLDVTAFPATNL